MRWGRDPTGLPKLSLEAKKICAGYASATFLARHLDTPETLPRSCRLHVEQEYASGVCVGDEILLGFPRRLSKKTDMRWVCASHIPRSSFGSSQDPARFHVEQGYASGVCAGDETPLAFPNRLSKKPDMRQVCASHIARSSSGSNWNTTSILLESIWSKGMRQGCALGKPRP